MKNFKWALSYFALLYLIGTVVGFGTYYIHEIAMWISMFTLMPVLFGYFFYLYLKKIKCSRTEVFRETNMLIIVWILLSFILDGLVYIAIIPLFFGHNPNWTFFIDQSPWIWLNYCTIIVLGHIARFFYVRRLEE